MSKQCMLVTVDWLRRHHACRDGLAVFMAAAKPKKSARLTVAFIRRLVRECIKADIEEFGRDDCNKSCGTAFAEECLAWIAHEFDVDRCHARYGDWRAWSCLFKGYALPEH